MKDKDLQKANRTRLERARLALNHGVPCLVVSKILGHSKTTTTLDIYGHLIPVMQEEAAKIMDEITTPIPVSFGENVEAGDTKKESTCTQLHTKQKAC